MAAKHADQKREVVTCRLEPDLIKNLDALATADRRSRSELIEQAVREFVAKHAKPKSKK